MPQLQSCGQALRGKVVLSWWLRCGRRNGRRKGRVVLLTGVWKDASQIQMGWGENEGHSKQGKGQKHINTKCQRWRKENFLRDPKGTRTDFVATQEGTGSCWNGSKARWKDLLCQDSVGRGRVVFKAFILNPFPAADMIFFSIYRIMLFVLS